MFATVSLLFLSFAVFPMEAAIPLPLLSIHPLDQNAPPASSDLIADLQRAAEAGDVHAQLKLGKAYRDGDGVPQNDVLAFKWLRKAAEQGDPAAENDLGILYGIGKGVERDKTEAVRWYGKAAKQGNAGGMFNLGAAYYNGDGVNTDDTASYAWFVLANEAGFPQAQEAVRRAETENHAGPAQAFMKIAQMYEAGTELHAKQAMRGIERLTFGSLAFCWRKGVPRTKTSFEKRGRDVKRQRNDILPEPIAWR